MKIDRRDFLKGVAGLGAATLIPTACSMSKLSKKDETCCEKSPNNSTESFSFVHITDQHVQKKRQGDKGYLTCIDSVKKLKPIPSFAVMGGDLAFDGNYNTKEKFIEDIHLYKDISDELEIPYFHCMGNHDVLGWHPRRKVSVDDPDLGKKCIMDILEWQSSYYSFDYKGWHFVILDSIKGIVDESKGPIYTPEIDAEQLEWLAADLGAAHGKPTVAFTHIAAICAQGQFEGNKERKCLDGGMVLNNTKELRLILERHKVKALVQGHSHQNEEYKYNDVSYITSASAGGAWWSGNWLGFDPGYTVFTCEGDKLFWERKTYLWEPRLEAADELERKKTQEYNDFIANREKMLSDEIAKGKSMIKKPIPKLSTVLK